MTNQSYNSNAFLGEIGAGLDLRVSKSISIEGSYKYNDVLSSNNRKQQHLLLQRRQRSRRL